MKINRESVTQQIYNDLRAKIVGGEYSPGMKLPSETSLAEEYGVSRLSVRAALQRLSTLGIIEIRNGEGSFVREINLTPLVDELSGLMENDNLMGDFLEFREAIEVAGAELMLANAAAEEMDQLVRTAEQLIAVAEAGDLDQYVEYEYRFHSSLCKLSHNKIFTILYSSVENLFKKTIYENIKKTQSQLGMEITEDSKLHLKMADLMRDRKHDEAIALLKHLIRIDLNPQEDSL